ncbi:glycerophosphodiester phosphodiesterase [bacterium]|nr:glycerophosphodiester phosphodiesterase [bacterium]
MLKLAVAAGSMVVVLMGLFAFATGAFSSPSAPAWLTAQKIAHRGLWTDGPAAPENSLAAFDAAAEAGYAVELDAQRSADGVTVVIHDYNLKEMTGEDAMVADTQSAVIAKLRLLGGDETVPTLAEALDLIDGRVPVFVEIKNEGEVGALEDDVAEQLSAYDGEAAVMSFNPFSLARVAEAAPEIPRGQLASAFAGEDLAWYEKLLLRNLLLNFQSKPDFIAYDIEELPSLGTRLQQWRRRPLLGWTIDDADELERAEAYADGFICNPGALE